MDMSDAKIIEPRSNAYTSNKAVEDSGKEYRSPQHDHSNQKKESLGDDDDAWAAAYPVMLDSNRPRDEWNISQVIKADESPQIKTHQSSAVNTNAKQ